MSQLIEHRLQALLTEMSNASFDCGAYDSEDGGPDEYQALLAISKAKRQAVVDFVLTALAPPPGSFTCGVTVAVLSEYCVIHQLSSRICERGTKGCLATHDKEKT